jgi:HAD superfamily hydrolase (TIGR01509 family)
MSTTWFLFDLGNTLIKLAYERVLENICRESTVQRDELIELLEAPGSYRDMERGAVTFWEFYEFLCDKAGYRGSIREFTDLWSDFFEGAMPGIEELLDRVRARYRVAFLSNSNEVHAQLIPRRFSSLFQKDDRFIFSYRIKVAKPDPEIFRRALDTIGALAHQVVFIDDLSENITAARSLGMQAFQFIDTLSLTRQLEAEGLI